MNETAIQIIERRLKQIKIVVDDEKLSPETRKAASYAYNYLHNTLVEIEHAKLDV